MSPYVYMDAEELAARKQQRAEMRAAPVETPAVDGDNLADHAVRVRLPAEDAWAPVRDAFAGLTLPLTLNRLRAFVAGTGARPSRGELRRWVGAALAGLHAEIDALRAQRDQVIEERDGLLEDFDRQRACVDQQVQVINDLIAERDQARRDLRKMTVKRDDAVAALDAAGTSVDVPGVVKAYEEMRAGLEATIAERNRYAHENRKLRAERAGGRAGCSHGVTVSVRPHGGGDK